MVLGGSHAGTRTGRLSIDLNNGSWGTWTLMLEKRVAGRGTVDIVTDLSMYSLIFASSGLSALCDIVGRQCSGD